MVISFEKKKQEPYNKGLALNELGIFGEGFASLVDNFLSEI